MGQTLIQRAFAGGELAPALHARADQAKYLTGLRTCRNFLVKRGGGVANRPGFRYINTAKSNGSTATFIFPYVSEIAGESVLIEAGPNYLRFYQGGALVTLSGVDAWDGGTAYAIGDIAVEGGVNYYCTVAHTNHQPPNASYWYAMPSTILEVPTPFGSAGFYPEQEGNVITLTSGTVAPYELICYGLTEWVIQAVVTAPTTPTPTNLAGTAGAPGALNYNYKVTAALADTYEESLASAIGQITNCAVPTQGAPNVLTWDAVTGAVEYYLYCDPYGNGTYGFLGTATGATSFKDIGFVPDFSVTPPLARVLFNATGDYPKVSGSHQQRRLFAHTINDPATIFGSRVGFRSNFNISSPLQDDDAITFRIAGKQRNPVRHIVGLKNLVVMTDGGEWTVGEPKTALAPANIPADQETYAGVAEQPKPVVVGNSILYVQARGSIVRDLRFDIQVEGLAGRDLTVFASHLFDGYTIDSMDFQQTPDSTVWCVRSDGTLLGLTYLREEDVWGWHRHDTGAAGRFEHVAVVPESGEDAVYVLVRRTIGGSFVRFIERLESRQILSYNADSFFVDAGLTYSGVPVSSISGLDHLNGQVVAVLADGDVLYDGDPAGDDVADFTVASGTIPAFAASYSVIHAGLPIRFAEVETLDLDVQGSSVRDKKKRVGNVNLLLETSARTFRAGPDENRLIQHRMKPWESGANVAFTGQVEIAINADWNDYGRILVRQTDPLPLTILGILPNVDIGG